MGLTGQEVSVDQGTAVAPNEDAVTGQITSAQGTAQGVTSHDADLTGFAITSGIGSVVVPNDATFNGLNRINLGSCRFRFRCKI